MESEKYTVIVNENVHLKQINVDELDLISNGVQSFNIIKDNKVFNAEIVEANFPGKSFKIKMNGTPYWLNIQDQFDELVNAMGLNVSASTQINDIKAPMPGLVLDIMVGAGDKIEKDTPLIILEAMKMENIIKSPGEGTIKSVEVVKGAAVEKGALLISLE